MKFCVIYKEEYPWDVRVEKIANTLSSEGHNVTILARNLKQQPTSEICNNFKIRRLLKTNWLPCFFQKLVNLALFFNPVWIYAIFKCSFGKDRPILIVRDLPLMFAAMLVSKIRKNKLIFDMAECYPEMYDSMRMYSNPSFFKKIICSKKVLEAYEKLACKAADSIFVMIEESRDRLIAKGISPQKIQIVSNTPPIDISQPAKSQHHGSALRMVYVGFLTNLRGLDIMVRAAQRFLEKGGRPNEIKIDIIGKGAAREELVALVSRLHLDQVVNIHGWLDKDEVDSILAQANVGVLTYRVCPHWNNTIPNKIFDYMKLGLPIITTDVIPIKRIIEETNAGYVCKDQDIDDIATKLMLLRDPLIREKMGNNGISFVKSRYNWNVDRSRMVLAIEGLVDRPNVEESGKE